MEAAGTQLEDFPPVVDIWHLNGPLPGFAGTQVSPHPLSLHGQTIFTQETKLPWPDTNLHPGGVNLFLRLISASSIFEHPGPALEQSTEPAFIGVWSSSRVVFNTKGRRVLDFSVEIDRIEQASLAQLINCPSPRTRKHPARKLSLLLRDLRPPGGPTFRYSAPALEQSTLEVVVDTAESVVASRAVCDGANVHVKAVCCYIHSGAEAVSH